MTTLTVMTWNIQNFFLAAHQNGPDTHEAFRSKLSSLTSVINLIKPDLLALQEVGGNSALTALQAALRHRMPFALSGTPDKRGIHVALLSIRRFFDIVHIPPFPAGVHPTCFNSTNPSEDYASSSGKRRGALQASIMVGDKSVTIVTAHFKSKLITSQGNRGLSLAQPPPVNLETQRYQTAALDLYQRTCEAMTVRAQLNTLLNNDLDLRGDGRKRALIFCGGLNDDPCSTTAQIIEGPPGSQVGASDFYKPGKEDGYRLWNLAPLLPEIAGEAAYTRKYRGRPELIDHIFATRALVNPEKLPIADITMTPEPLPNIDDAPNGRRNKPGSDHAAIFATFIL